MNAITDIRSDTELLWFGNTLVTFPVSWADNSAQLSILEQWAPHGESPPLHIHHSQDETFVVLQGRIRMVVDGKEMFLDAGQCALAPKGITDSYRVESLEGAHLLAITNGSDFERMVRNASRPAQYPDLPMCMAPTPEAIAMLTAVCAAARIELVGPPLA